MHSYFFVLEEFWDAYDEFQPRGHCLRKDDFSHGRSTLFSEDSEEILFVGPTHDGFEAPTPLVGTFFIELFHYKLFHTPMETNTHMSENWVRRFFLLVPHEKHEAPTYSIDELMVQPCGINSAPFPSYV